VGTSPAISKRMNVNALNKNVKSAFTSELISPPFTPIGSDNKKVGNHHIGAGNPSAKSPEGPNPFDDNHSQSHPGKAPFLRPLSDAEMAKENVDTREEIEWGKMMSGQRNVFLHKLVSSQEDEKKNKAAAPHFVPEPQSATQPSTSRTRPQRRGYEPSREETGFMYYVPGEERSPAGSSSATTHPTTPADEPPPHAAPSESGRERSMLNQAWHTIKNTDPLLDSDEEHPDEHNRVEYGTNVVSFRGNMLDYDRASSQHPVASGRW
ncbi:hypothetical protein MPER_04492, partial [Moniliophthora perniciosa FA553]